MGLTHGVTTGKVMTPLLVDASGRVLVATDGTGLIELNSGTRHIGQVSLDAALPAGTNLMGDVQARQLGYISGAWQKDPLRLGYSGQYYEDLTKASAGGTDYLTSTAVPAGYLYIVEAMAGWDSSSALTGASINLFTPGGNAFTIAQTAALTAGTPFPLLYRLTLSPAEKLRFYFLGSTAGDTLIFRLHGYVIRTNL